MKIYGIKKDLYKPEIDAIDILKMHKSTNAEIINKLANPDILKINMHENYSQEYHNNPLVDQGELI